MIVHNYFPWGPLFAAFKEMCAASHMNQKAESYFELVQVGGALPVLVIADSCHAGKADRDAVSGVHF